MASVVFTQNGSKAIGSTTGEVLGALFTADPNTPLDVQLFIGSAVADESEFAHVRLNASQAFYLSFPRPVVAAPNDAQVTAQFNDSGALHKVRCYLGN